ncbi:hypothetical protein [Vibrio owensii]|uniref:hypothetical protein n=1 Tax=Vibrio owensii TaxID=696485 RepID=UPI003CC5D035
MNRIWAVLGALDTLEEATIASIAEKTGFPRPSVSDVIKKLMDGQVPFVKIEKNGSSFKIIEWSDPKSAIQDVFNKAQEQSE